MIKKFILPLCLLPIISCAGVELPPVPVPSGFPGPNQTGFHAIKIKEKSPSVTSEPIFHNTNDSDRYINFLSHLKEKAPLEIDAYKNNNDISDTHLKSNYSQIKLSIPYQKPPVIKNDEIIGYAAIGGYEGGWTGVKMFFSRNDLGTCGYAFEKYLAANADQNKIHLLVHKKPSYKTIRGNYNNGFIYTLIWLDDKKTHLFNYQIDCFNKNLDTRILDRMIDLANQIPLN